MMMKTYLFSYMHQGAESGMAQASIDAGCGGIFTKMPAIVPTNYCAPGAGWFYNESSACSQATPTRQLAYGLRFIRVTPRRDGDYHIVSGVEGHAWCKEQESHEEPAHWIRCELSGVGIKPGMTM